MNEYDEINTNIKDLNINENNDEKIYNQSYEYTSKNPLIDISHLSNQTQNSFLLESKNGDLYEPLELDSDEEEEIKEDIKIVKNENFQNIMKNLNTDINNFIKKIETYNDYPFFRIQNTIKYIPKLSKESEILNKYQLRELHANLPYYQQYKNLVLLYSMSYDGTLLKTFYEKCQDYQNTILIAKDDSNNIFGAYVSDYFKCLYNEFYGTAETFLFTFFNSNRIHCFNATRENEYYIYSDDKKLAFGCSDDNFSLSFDHDVWEGFTDKTKTYNNLPLSINKNFNTVKLEVWSFQL